jgi:hypothetical protein
MIRSTTQAKLGIVVVAMSLVGCGSGRGSFMSALTKPAPAAATLPSTFDPLLGSWSLAVTYAPGTDSAVTWPGEWHFARVLEGRAIQDVWRVVATDSAGMARLRGYGTTLRTWDPAIEAWRSTWIGVLNATVTPFIGRTVNGEILLEPAQQDSAQLYRWVFFDIRARTFRWRAELSEDKGKTWRVEQEMYAKRSSGPDDR